MPSPDGEEQEPGPPLRFFVDEDVDVKVAAYLDRRGHDVLTVLSIFGEQSSDPENMAWAKTHGRILLTCDWRFVRNKRLSSKRSAVLVLHDLYSLQVERVAALIDDIEREAAIAGDEFFMMIRKRDFMLQR